MDDFRVVLFFYIVQGILMGIVGLRLFDFEINFKKIGLVGVIYGLAIWVVRGIYNYFDVPFGTHTFILMLIFLILVKVISKTNWNTALGATLVSSCLVMLGSALSGPVIQLFHLDVQDVLKNPWLYVAVGNIENVFLVAMLVINNVSGFTLTKHLEYK